MMTSWSFPGNQNGQIKGVADAGIENFNGTELSSLARENCQNSLDAAVNEDDPNVLVEFERYFVPSSQIPGMTEYRKILKDCKLFWDKSNSEKAKSFLNKAIKYADSEKSFVLRISDFNTSGLSDPYAMTDDPYNFSFDGWNALVKIDGGANKGDDKAGAFGIGKSAPFSNSYYRLVFYRTINQNGEQAAQGISRLLSYPDKAIMTTGVGYYGNPNGNNPVESIRELDDLKKREETGTDVFIFGFKAFAEWESEITTALLENFLMSFYYGQLKVKVQGREINSETLGAFMNQAHIKHPAETKGTYGNYLALTRNDDTVHTFSQNFHGLGTLEFRVLVDPNEKLDRKVLVVRKAGMKLFRLGNISRLIPFTGILELKGKELNRYFRSMETVAHDNWEPGRHSDPKQAKKYYEEIKDWIRNIVAELAEQSNTDEMDVNGLSGILQKEPDKVETGNSDNIHETLNDKLGTIDIIDRPSKTQAKGLFYGKGNQNSQEMDLTTGTLGKEGESGLRLLKGKRKRKKTDTHKGKPDPNGKDRVNKKKTGEATNCPLQNVRIIKKGISAYTITFQTPFDIDLGRLELATVGENGKSNQLRITSVKVNSGCRTAQLSGNDIEIQNIVSEKKVNITVTLADSRDYAADSRLRRSSKT